MLTTSVLGEVEQGDRRLDLQWQFAMDILEKILSNLFSTEHNMGVTRLYLFRHVCFVGVVSIVDVLFPINTSSMNIE